MIMKECKWCEAELIELLRDIRISDVSCKGAGIERRSARTQRNGMNIENAGPERIKKKPA